MADIITVNIKTSSGSGKLENYIKGVERKCWVRYRGVEWSEARVGKEYPYETERVARRGS
jgi:hypothetical protein